MTNTNTRWLVGSNMPGYMPDNEPFEADDWDHAKDCCQDDLFRDWNDAEEEAFGDDYHEAISNLRKLAPEQEFGWTVNNRHYWIAKA